MSDTAPSAYRAEAAAKRVQITQLAGEVEALEAQADELDGIKPAEFELPAGGETFDPTEQPVPTDDSKESGKSGGLFNKK